MEQFFLLLANNHKSKFGLFILLLVCLSPVVHAEHWQSKAYISASFNKITMKNVPLKKWRNPIYYEIEHHVDDVSLHEKLVVIQLKQLQEITGVVIQPATSAHKANMTIVLTTENKIKTDIQHYFNVTDERTIENLSKNKIGVTSLMTNKDGYIQQSTVIIPTDRARAYGRLLTSFAEMLSRAMGMQHHSTDVYPSIFNGRSIDTFLTGLDYVMLKLLYDVRIKPNIEGAKIQQLVLSILNETNYQRFIEGADLAVRQNGLNRLIN